MSGPTIAELLHLVDRAERGTLLAGEAVQLRAGIRALGAARVASEDPVGPQEARECGCAPASRPQDQKTQSSSGQRTTGPSGAPEGIRQWK